jgi:hypothetical protein
MQQLPSIEVVRLAAARGDTERLLAMLRGGVDPPPTPANKRLEINCKPCGLGQDQCMVLYLDDKNEPWGRIPHWERGEVRAAKIVNCRRTPHARGLWKFTFKSVEARREHQREVLIDARDCERVLQWFCNAWGEVDKTGKMQVSVETVGMYGDDIGYRLLATSPPSTVSNECRYYVKANSMIRVAIRNLSNESISFTPVYRASGLEPDPDPNVTLSEGAEALLSMIQVDCDFAWSLENSGGVPLPKLVFEIEA